MLKGKTYLLNYIQIQQWHGTPYLSASQQQEKKEE